MKIVSAFLFILFVIFCVIQASIAQDTSKTVQLGVKKAGDSAGMIGSSPPGIHCGDGATDCTATFKSGTAITLTPEESAGSVFVGWYRAKGSTTPCEGVKGPCSFVITENSVVIGTFQHETSSIITLSVTVQGSGKGVVTSVPEGILCGDDKNRCTVSFPANAAVTLTAQPTTQDSVFQGWQGGTGSVQSCNNTSSSCEFSIAENTAISANFDLSNTGSPTAGELTLTANKTGNGLGMIVSAPPGIECGNGGTNCSATFPAGTSITLTGKPTAARSTFSGWTAGTGSGTTCMGAAGPCAFTITEESAVSGQFVQQ